MSMKKREKILATLFAGVLAGWGSLSSLESWLATGTSADESHTSVLQRETAALTQEAEFVDVSLQRLKAQQEQSLPGDSGKAASLYQAWLMKRLEDSGLKNATVTPAPPIADENIGTRILASIEASRSENCDCSLCGRIRFDTASASHVRSYQRDYERWLDEQHRNDRG